MVGLVSGLVSLVGGGGNKKSRTIAGRSRSQQWCRSCCGRAIAGCIFLSFVAGRLVADPRTLFVVAVGPASLAVGTFDDRDNARCCVSFGFCV